MAESKSLREKILETNDIKSETVVIPEWGNAKVSVRTMTAGQRSDMLEKCINKKGDVDNKKIYVYTVIYCAYDPETGDKIFSESDYNALNGKSSNALEAILAVANKINGLGEKEIGELEKN